jgi:hypothetical protein
LGSSNSGARTSTPHNHKTRLVQFLLPAPSDLGHTHGGLHERIFSYS